MRLSITLLLFICISVVFAQKDIETALELQLSEIIITDSRAEYFSEDRKVEHIDSLTIASHQTDNIGELLSRSSTLMVKTYGGAGNIASVAMRGCSANHTLVSWNGLPVNSITTGSADLSLLPVSFSESVTINYGASGSLFGSGTFGGSIDLSVKPDWKTNNPKTVSNLHLGFESFGAIKQIFGFKFYGDRLQAFTNILSQTAKNNFEYTDNQQFESPILERQNNALRSFGVTQHLYYKLNNKNQLQFAVWQFNKTKQVPEPLGVTKPGNALQEDQSFKSYLKWQRTDHRSALSVQSAFLYDFLRYTDKINSESVTYSIYSTIQSTQFRNQINYRFYTNKNFSFDFGFSSSYLTASTQNFVGTEAEFQNYIYTATKYKNKNLVVNASVREEFYEQYSPSPLFSIGMHYALFDGRIRLLTSYSNKYRIPNFNEKYWQPGGNPDLKPENGFSNDFGIKYLAIKSNYQYLTFENTIFSTQIYNRILWIPGEEIFWTPVNISSVWSRGLESSVDYTLDFYPFRFDAKFHYTLTKSTITDDYENPANIGKQLAYTPKHAANASLNFSYKILTFSISNRYIGERYVFDSNTSVLDDFMITDTGFRISKEFKALCIDFNVAIDNIFTIDYQLSNSYPMPGRIFKGGVNIKFSK